MSTGAKRNTPTVCNQCTETAPLYKCMGCSLAFCQKHWNIHEEEINQIMVKSKKTTAYFLEDLQNRNLSDLSRLINEWEKKAIDTIQRTAQIAHSDLKTIVEKSDEQIRRSICNTEKDVSKLQEKHQNLRDHVSELERIYKQLRTEIEQTPCKLIFHSSDDPTRVSLIKIIASERPVTHEEQTSSAIESGQEARKTPKSRSIPSNQSETSNGISILLNGSSHYPVTTFGLEASSDNNIETLFKNLMVLKPMEKQGPMSGRCSEQTNQMENFLQESFGFKNIPGEYIVHGVKSFKLQSKLSSMNKDRKIYFPTAGVNAFAMTIEEIIKWQHSYKVYADKYISGMDKDFLARALQGKSHDGEEAFRMKFVIRISTCPILMEFDAKIITRNLNEDWPNRIKLVSVTGIDFAGRKHDVCDILNYVTNWKDVYEVHTNGNVPALANERDFCLKRSRVAAELHETRLLGDLKYMARLRLHACDAEAVQIVVETGIGLGVFSGEQIGISEKVITTSAIAIRAVLEEDGPKFKNIRAIVFALPIFETHKSSFLSRNVFTIFNEQFHEPMYKGSIPVLIADQDMHRLAVAIARQGYIVSELNPADSHGVFGEYWQNHGPAVEEKLALTTVGLLVQHHLINPEVLNKNRYHLL